MQLNPCDNLIQFQMIILMAIKTIGLCPFLFLGEENFSLISNINDWFISQDNEWEYQHLVGHSPISNNCDNNSAVVAKLRDNWSS